MKWIAQHKNSMQRICSKVIGALAGIGVLGGAGLNSVQACTSFTLKGNDGGHVYGRTMEFGQPLNVTVLKPS